MKYNKRRLIPLFVIAAMLNTSTGNASYEIEGLFDTSEIETEISANWRYDDSWLIEEIQKQSSENQPEVIQDSFRVFDIPLSEDLQRHTYDLAQQYGIDYELFLSLLWVETGGTFKHDLISPTNDYGVAQINKINHGWLRDAGLLNMLDPYQSINAGAIILGGLVEKYGNSHQALMAYNFGEGGMRKVWRNGHRSSGYSRKVFNTKESLFN